MHTLDERQIILFLIQIFVLLGAAKLLGLLFQKWKQPTVTADILVGILLGPTLLGRTLPHLHGLLFPADPVQQTMLETVAWTGILFLLLDTGLEVNFSRIWKQRGESLKISVSDTIIPVIIAIIPVYFLFPDSWLIDPSNRFLFALFIAVIMTISAMPVSIRAMHDLGILKSDMGFLIVSALAFNDIVGWVAFTIILGVFSRAGVDLMNILLIVGMTLGFTAFALTLGRRFSDRMLGLIRTHGGERSGFSLTFVVLFGLLFGAITGKIGIHALFGFFIAGLVAGESKNLLEKDRQAISRMVYAVFVPVFFASVGLKTDFAAGFNLPLFLLISVIGVGGRYLGAWVGCLIARVPASNRAPISIAHTPGGEMHIVVSMIAFEMGLITQTVFVAIVCAAVFSSVTMGPWMSWALRKKKEIGLKELFRKGLTLIPVRSATREEALTELAASAGRLTNLPEDQIYKGLTDREHAMTTALENGVAIPHARLAGLETPLILAGHSQPGIDWDSPDGKRSRFFFLILTPENDPDVQLRILSTLARKLADRNFMEKLFTLQAGDSLDPLISLPA